MYDICQQPVSNFDQKISSGKASTLEENSLHEKNLALKFLKKEILEKIMKMGKWLENKKKQKKFQLVQLKCRNSRKEKIPSFLLSSQIHRKKKEVFLPSQ